MPADGRPQGLSVDYLKKQGMTRMPSDGIHTVTVPGCVAGWEKLHKRFGRLPGATSSSPPFTMPRTASR